MKTRCPFCDARQTFLDEMQGLGVTCSKCGQTFELNQHNPTLPSARSLFNSSHLDTANSIADNVTTLDTSKATANMPLLSRGFWLMSRGWMLVSISSVMLVLGSVVGRLEILNPALVHIYVVVTKLLIASVVASSATYVIGQGCCLMAHPADSVLRPSISKCMKFSAVGVALRIAAIASGHSLFKTVGSVVAASAFNHFLVYLRNVATQFGDRETTAAIERLAQLYRRAFGYAILGFLVLVAVPVPPHLMRFMFFGFVGLLMIFLGIFASQFGTILFKLSRAVRSQLPTQQTVY